MTLGNWALCAEHGVVLVEVELPLHRVLVCPVHGCGYEERPVALPAREGG